MEQPSRHRPDEQVASDAALLVPLRHRCRRLAAEGRARQHSPGSALIASSTAIGLSCSSSLTPCNSSLMTRDRVLVSPDGTAFIRLSWIHHAKSAVRAARRPSDARPLSSGVRAGDWLRALRCCSDQRATLQRSREGDRLSRRATVRRPRCADWLAVRGECKCLLARPAALRPRSASQVYMAFPAQRFTAHVRGRGGPSHEFNYGDELELVFFDTASAPTSYRVCWGPKGARDV